VSDCEQCKSFYLELENVTKESDEARANYAFMVERAADENLDGYRELGARCAAAENERDAAQAKAVEYERDWYAAKSEFGTAMAKMRETLRAAEQRELVALAELDEATAEIERLRWGNEMACEDTPTPGCECRGCSLARDRAERGVAGPEDER